MIEYELLKQSGWFDEEFYLLKYPDVAESGIDPIQHYLAHGAAENRQPHPDFDVATYLAQCRDMGLEVSNALLHFLQDGMVLGLDPSPAPTGFEVDKAFVRQVVAQEFDYGYYLAENPDVREAGIDPLQHYLDMGWREGRNPSPDFDTQFYLDGNEDVEEAGVNPYFHFLAAGRPEGRSGLPPLDDEGEEPEFTDEAEESGGFQSSETASSPPPAPPVDVGVDDFTRATVAAAFDRDYYLRRNPDIAEAGVDPLEHFLVTGWREGRDPCWSFDTSFYLYHYDDIRSAGVNPFFHYLVAGRSEGRKAKDDLAIEVAVLDAAKTPSEAAKAWLRADLPDELSAAVFSRRLAERAISNARGTCIAVSHDNYLTVVGGVQNCITDEQAAFNGLSYNYVQIFPTQPLPLLSEEKRAERQLVTVTCNGGLVGTVSVARLGAVLAKSEPKPRKAGQPKPATILVLHSMLGHSPEALTQLVAELGIQQAYFWLHDYSSLCESFTLMRNDLTFCHAPPVTSQACRLCAYGLDRPLHIKRYSAMFKKLRPVVLSPSQAALDVWRKHTFDLPNSGEHVIPHTQFLPARKRAGSNAVSKPDNSAVRVGFLGYDKYHKGWATFERLAASFNGERFSFHHLGRRHDTVPHIDFTPVDVTHETRDAMIDAVRKQKLDLVLVWPAWPETYSFVAYEAIAAGALVLTHAESGNVVAAVTGADAGVVVADEEALFALFEANELRKRSLRRRREPDSRQRLAYSGCTASLFSDGAH